MNKSSSSIGSIFNRINIWSNFLAPLLLGFVTFLFYYPSLNYPFQFDDIANITKRFAIRFDLPFYRWISSTRWLGETLNILNFRIGRFDPFYYRLFNIIIHIATGIVIFFLIKKLCQCWKQKQFFYENASLISFITAALFLLHPVQTQTVSYVIQARLEGLATFFVLTTLLVFVYAFLAKTFFSRVSLFALGCFLTFLSSGTKEIAVVTPVLLVLVDWFFVAEENWANFKNRAFYYMIFAVVFVSAALTYFGWPMIKNSILLKSATMNNRGNILTPSAFDVITPYMYLISEFKILVHYITMFIWPIGISVDYDWKISESFFSADAFFPFLVLATLIAVSFYLAKNKKMSFFAFGFFWFLITMAPRTTLIPSPELVSDYKTYLASVGILFILGVCLSWCFLKASENVGSLASHLKMPSVQYITLMILMLPLGYSMYQRNLVWSSSVRFWQDTVEKAPNKARAHNNFGVALVEAGKHDEAIKEYLTAIALDKNYSDPWSNVSVAYSLKGNIDEAIAALKSAIHICPNYPEAYNNLGSLFIRKQNYDDAEKILKIALNLRPYYGKAHYNLGRLYLEKKDNDKAWQCFKNATQGDLDSPEGFFTYGQMSLRLQKYKDAVYAFEQILARGYCTPQILFNLANSYFLDQKFERAEKVYGKLVQDNPLDPRFAYNLAETLFAEKKYQAALEFFRKTTTLPSPVPQSFFRVAKCLECMKMSGEAKKYLENLMDKDFPVKFKEVAKNEITRIGLQEKLNAGNGSIKYSEFKNIMNAKQELEAKIKA